MKVSLAELARLVDGCLIGDATTRIHRAAVVWEAGPGDITFAESPRLAEQAALSGASAVLALPECYGAGCAEESQCSEPANPQNGPQNALQNGPPRILVNDVHASFAKIVQHFRPPYHPPRIGVSPAATISDSAKIAEDVDVYPGAFIGEDVEIGAGAVIHAGVHIMANAKIGEKTVLYPRVVLYERTVIGPRSILHAGVVIGGYGFGYRTVAGKHQLASQLGHVEIGAEVEIGANTTIDRGTYGATVIGEGTKLDNQVMIAHNCRIGRHNMICSQVGIAGSCVTGDYVVMAGQVGLRDHLNIGDRAVLGAKAGVMHNIPAGSVYLGIPATPEREQMHCIAVYSKLPQMRKQLKALQKQVDTLSKELAPAPSM